jgi:hypothetical protein
LKTLVDNYLFLKDVPKVPPVVALGGSYSGASAAWVRMRYPDTVAAAVAESGPVVATYDFFAYDRSNKAAFGSPPGPNATVGCVGVLLPLLSMESTAAALLSCPRLGSTLACVSVSI